MHIRSQFESNARNNPASSDCMSGAIRFNASSVTKNATSIALSYPQKRTARRVASNARLLLGKLSVIALPFEAVSVVRSQPRPPNAALSRHPLSRAKYLLHARAAAATPKQTAAANVRLNRVVHMSRSSRLQAGARPVSLPPAPVLLRFMVGDGRGCALSVALSRGVRSLSAITWHC